MKNKQNIKFLLIIPIIAILAVIGDLLLFNSKLFFLPNNEKGKVELLDNNIKIEDYDHFDKDTQNIVDSKKITINFDSKYVKKYVVNYNIKETSKALVKYEFYDNYNNIAIEETEEEFNDKINLFVVNQNRKLKSVEIIVNNKDINIDNVYINNNININKYRVLFMMVIMWSIFISVYYFRKKLIKEKLANLFLWLIIPIGLLVIYCQPAMCYSSWDDQTHYQNIYKLFRNTVYWDESSLSMLTPYPFRTVSYDTFEEIKEVSKYLDEHAQNIIAIENHRFLINYIEVGYIPSAIGINIARLFNLSFTIMFKLGKMFNFLFYSIIMYFGIKNAKIGKRILAVIALIPTSVFLATQYSYDPPITATIILSLVFLFNELVDKESKLNIKKICLILLPIIFACCIKAIYAPLILLILFIPKSKFKNNKQSKKFKISIILIFLLMLATFVLPTVANPSDVADLRGGNTSVSGQLHLILNHPIGYIKILKDSMVDMYSSEFFSHGALANFAYNGLLSSNLYYLFLGMLFFVTMTDVNKKYKLNGKYKSIIILLILGIILLIWTALYLSFTPVGLIGINGVQARYFIPLLFPLLICFNSSKIENKFDKDLYSLIIMIMSILILLIGIFENIIVFYCF